MKTNTLLFGDISKHHFRKDKIEQKHSGPTVQPPSFRPRKGIKYALGTPVAGSETEVSVADVPAYLEQLMGWNSGFAYPLRLLDFMGTMMILTKFYRDSILGKREGVV
jgi:hypothetical protein